MIPATRSVAISIINTDLLQLLHQPERVEADPGADDLVLLEVPDRDPGRFDGAAGRRDPEELAVVSAPHSPAVDDLARLRDLLLAGELDVGETAAPQPDHCIETSWPWRDVGR